MFSSEDYVNASFAREKRNRQASFRSIESEKKESLPVLQRAGPVNGENSDYAKKRRRAAAPSPSKPEPKSKRLPGSGVGVPPPSNDSLHGVVRTLVVTWPCLSVVVSTSKPMIKVPADNESGVEKLMGPLKAPKFTRNTSYPPADGLNEFAELKLC